MKKLNKAETLLCWMTLFVMTFFIIASRRPDIIFNPQPWAEDGKIWLESIYNNGFWSSIFLPQNGYYQTISRLTYGIAIVFGISKAALVANTIAISIRCFFILFLLSQRLSFIKIQYRIVTAVYFLIMPNLWEGYVNITNAHWYLSLYLMAVVLADDTNSRIWKLHDYTLLIISALSGPFVVFIAPCLIIKRISQRGGIINAIKGINAFDITMAVCCVIQVAAILTSSDTERSPAPLGATFSLLIDIIGYRVVGGSFFPNEYITSMAGRHELNIILCAALVLTMICLLWKSDWRYKSAVLFPVLMLGFALAKPMISLDQPQWPPLLVPGVGERYFFITNFSFFCLILFVVNKISKGSNIPLLILAIVTTPFMLRGYTIPPMAEVGYRQDIKTFSGLASGESMQIHINPPGWTMELRKH